MGWATVQGDGMERISGLLYRVGGSAVDHALYCAPRSNTFPAISKAEMR
jgi:hypothetical protein